MENSITVAARTVVTGLDLSLFKKARSYCTLYKWLRQRVLNDLQRTGFVREFWMIYKGPGVLASHDLAPPPPPPTPFLPSVTFSNLLQEEGGEWSRGRSQITSEKTWSSIQNSILLGFAFLAYLPSAQCWNLADFRNSVADFRNNVQVPVQPAAKALQRDSKSKPSSYKVVCFRLSSLIAYIHCLPLFTWIEFHKNLKENIWISVYLKVGTNEILGGGGGVMWGNGLGPWRLIIYYFFRCCGAINIFFCLRLCQSNLAPTRTFLWPLDFFFIIDSFIRYLENYLLWLKYFLMWIDATMTFLYKISSSLWQSSNYSGRQFNYGSPGSGSAKQLFHSAAIL